MMSNKKIGSILLIDEQDSFVALVKSVIARLGNEMGEIHFATLSSPERLKAYMNHEGEYWNAPTPNLILVNGNMPRKMNGTFPKELRVGTVANAIPVLPVIVDEEEGAQLPNQQDAFESIGGFLRTLLNTLV